MSTIASENELRGKRGVIDPAHLPDPKWLNKPVTIVEVAQPAKKGPDGQKLPVGPRLLKVIADDGTVVQWVSEEHMQPLRADVKPGTDPITVSRKSERSLSMSATDKLIAETEKIRAERKAAGQPFNLSDATKEAGIRLDAAAKDWLKGISDPDLTSASAPQPTSGEQPGRAAFMALARRIQEERHLSADGAVEAAFVMLTASMRLDGVPLSLAASEAGKAAARFKQRVDALHETGGKPWDEAISIAETEDAAGAAAWRLVGLSSSALL
jgi:hypothetical protein